MTSHRSKSLYAIKECSICGRLYTKECCSIGSLDDKILVPEPDSSPCCARCGTPVDGPSCRGCAFLRKKFDEDLLAYCIENGIFQDFQDTSESSDDNTNVVNAIESQCVVNQTDPISELVESLENRDILNCFNSSKIDPILEEFAGELTHIAPIPPGIVEADFDPNDDTLSDDDSFENIEYVDASYIEYDSFEEENEEQEKKEFDLEDIFQIQDVILREKLLNVHRLISKIESLKDNPTPDLVFESPSPFPILVADSDSFLEESDTSLSHLYNSLPKFETFSDHTEETRSGNTTTHANYSLSEYDSFLFEIEPDQEGMLSTDNSNEPLLELPKFESYHFDLSFPRPPPEPLDVCLDMSFEPGEGENIVVSNVEEDDSFTFTIRTFLPFVTYPE
ncbi:hypothetical protein Tco_1053240, partial [Tanacetum coccineum]